LRCGSSRDQIRTWLQECSCSLDKWSDMCSWTAGCFFSTRTKLFTETSFNDGDTKIRTLSALMPTPQKLCSEKMPHSASGFVFQLSSMKVQLMGRERNADLGSNCTGNVTAPSSRLGRCLWVASGVSTWLPGKANVDSGVSMCGLWGLT
jgi:hypothetical protein